MVPPSDQAVGGRPLRRLTPAAAHPILGVLMVAGGLPPLPYLQALTPILLQLMPVQAGGIGELHFWPSCHSAVFGSTTTSP